MASLNTVFSYVIRTVILPAILIITWQCWKNELGMDLALEKNRLEREMRHINNAVIQERKVPLSWKQTRKKIGNSEGTSFVYHKNVLLTYNTLIEIQFNKKLSWEDVSIEQHEKNGQYQNDLLHFYKGFWCHE